MNRKLSRLAAAGIMGFALFTGSFSASAAPAWSLPESGLQMDNASNQAYIYKEMYASFHPAKDAKQPEGSHPNSENLGKLRTGLTKTQVYELIGTPHYSEGFGAREWDYLLHQSSSNVVCQLKLIYDKQMLVGSIHTKPEGCVKLK